MVLLTQQDRVNGQGHAPANPLLGVQAEADGLREALLAAQDAGEPGQLRDVVGHGGNEVVYSWVST